MRRQAWMFLALATMLALPSVYAQLTTQVVADVPFAFTVNNQTLPAGRYQVFYGPSPSTVVIQSEDREHTVITIANSAEEKAPVKHSELLFRRYGDRYFLSEIFQAGALIGRELPRSKVEQEMARHSGTSGSVGVLASGQ